MGHNVFSTDNTHSNGLHDNTDNDKLIKEIKNLAKPRQNAVNSIAHHISRAYKVNYIVR